MFKLDMSNARVFNGLQRAPLVIAVLCMEVRGVVVLAGWAL